MIIVNEINYVYIITSIIIALYLDVLLLRSDSSFSSFIFVVKISSAESSEYKQKLLTFNFLNFVTGLNVDDKIIPHLGLLLVEFN